MRRRSRNYLMMAIMAVTGAIILSATMVKRSAAAEDNGIEPAERSWSQATGDSGNRRYSALSQIDTSTVKNLGAAWVTDKFEDGGSSRVTPVVDDGVMFVTAGNKVYALDAKTGKAVWKYQTTAATVVARGLGPTSQEGQGIYARCGRGRRQGVRGADGRGNDRAG